MIANILDLSHPLASGMQVYPGDPDVTISPAVDLPDGGVAVSALRLGSHAGTHLDAPSHCIPGGRTTSEIVLDELVGPALVLHLRGLDNDSEIDWQAVGPAIGERVPGIVLVHTGWDRHFGTDRYLRHPFLSRHAAGELCERGMHVLGLDTLSADRTAGQGAGGLPVHREVLGRNGLIVENLRGLGALATTATVGFFPLPVNAGDGAPVRAVAFVGTRWGD